MGEGDHSYRGQYRRPHFHLREGDANAPYPSSLRNCTSESISDVGAGLRRAISCGREDGDVKIWDVGMGLVKAFFFGISIALISCHRGLNSQPGAEGVGRAATEAFVASFVVILILDFFLAMLLINLYEMFLNGGPHSML